MSAPERYEWGFDPDRTTGIVYAVRRVEIARFTDAEDAQDYCRWRNGDRPAAADSGDGAEEPVDATRFEPLTAQRLIADRRRQLDAFMAEVAAAAENPEAAPETAVVVDLDAMAAAADFDATVAEADAAAAVDRASAARVAAVEAAVDAALANTDTIAATNPDTGETASVSSTATACLTPETAGQEAATAPETGNPVSDPTGGDPYHEAGEAFARLKAGEQLGLVADELGLKMPVLRSRWARYQKALNAMAWQPGATVAKPAAPPSDDDGWAVCPRCRTKFNAAKAQQIAKLPERPTRCAACR